MRGGVITEENPHGSTKTKRQQDTPHADHGDNFNGTSGTKCQRQSDQNPNHATTDREHKGFDQELRQDVPGFCAQSFTNPDFPGSFGDRHKHDVHDANAADQQTDARHAAQEQGQDRGDLVDAREGIGLVGNVKIVIVWGFFFVPDRQQIGYFGL